MKKWLQVLTIAWLLALTVAVVFFISGGALAQPLKDYFVVNSKGDVELSGNLILSKGNYITWEERAMIYQGLDGAFYIKTPDGRTYWNHNVKQEFSLYGGEAGTDMDVDFFGSDASLEKPLKNSATNTFRSHYWDGENKHFDYEVKVVPLQVSPLKGRVLFMLEEHGQPYVTPFILEYSSNGGSIIWLSSDKVSFFGAEPVGKQTRPITLEEVIEYLSKLGLW